MFDLVNVLLQMQKACPVSCIVSISNDYNNKEIFYFCWEYKVKGKLHVLKVFQTLMELEKLKTKLPFYPEEVRLRIKNSCEKE